jgi:arginine decarboxylase
MKTKYIDLIEQTFDWPQEEFRLEDNSLLFHNVPLMELVKKYGSPLKFTYLPKISQNIQRAKTWFRNAKEEVGYEGEYHYCYCTKSSHFRYVLEEALKNDIHLETSSAYDIDLVKRLFQLKKIRRSFATASKKKNTLQKSWSFAQPDLKISFRSSTMDMN